MFISIEVICAYLLGFYRRSICIHTVEEFALYLQVSVNDVLRAESGGGGAEELWVLNVGDDECLPLVVEELKNKGWVIGSKSLATFAEWFTASFHAIDRGMEGKIWGIFLNLVSHGVKNIVSFASPEQPKPTPMLVPPVVEIAEPITTPPPQVDEVVEEFTSSEPSEMLRLTRKEKGVSQKELAKLLGVSQTTISSMERGTSPIPNGFLAKAVDALKNR